MRERVKEREESENVIEAGVGNKETTFCLKNTLIMNLEKADVYATIKIA